MSTAPETAQADQATVLPEQAAPTEHTAAPLGTAGLPTSYNISITPVQTPAGKAVRIVLTFVKPEALAGQEYCSFMLPYQVAGMFARKIESARKHIRK